MIADAPRVRSARKEVEAAHCGRLASGLHSYSVWFHFAGRLLSLKHDVDEQVSPMLSWAISDRRDLVRAAFGSSPVLQLDLTLQIPWTIDWPEPD